MDNVRKKLAAAVVVGAVALSSGAALAPLAEAQNDRSEQREQRRDERMANREARLQQMVDDGVITQERADEIRARHAERAASREERRAARTERREALAATLGTTADELKAELRTGTSLADIAEAAGVEIDVVIDQLIESKAARLSDAVAAGRIDQATADARLETIRDRITTRVNG